MVLNLDADESDADWMKGGGGWPYGNTVIQVLEHFHLRNKPIYVQRNRLAEAARGPWWDRTIPPDLKKALQEAGLLD